MQSGLFNSPAIESLGATGQTQLDIALSRTVRHTPFTRYHYNNAPYRLLFTVLERASDRDLETLTAEEIFAPLGFDQACWAKLYAVDDDGSEVFQGYQSIRMRPRDFAKSVHVIGAGGTWRGEPFLPEAFVRALVTAPAPAINPSFGLFHHLNSGSFYRGFNVPVRLRRRLVPGAPADTFLMFGSGGQVTVAVPSRDLVLVRTGANAGSIYDPHNYIAQLIRTVVDASG